MLMNLYRSNMFRLIKNIYFIVGCIIALAATIVITNGEFAFPFLLNMTASERLLFTGGAMVLFFSMFTTLFINPEYAEGCIRNRIIAGYSQKEIFISHVLSQVSAVVIMYVCYILGGIIGGASFSGDVVLRLLVSLITLIAYASLMSAAAYRLKSIIAAMITTMMIFDVCFNCVLFGNAIMMNLTGTAARIGSVIYNINALGQWFCISGLADDHVDPGAFAQILISLCVMCAAFLWGISGLKKRDLK